MESRYIDRKGNKLCLNPIGDYTWSPREWNPNKRTIKSKVINNPTHCTAVGGSTSGPGSWDINVTYVYDVTNTPGGEQHTAYVECGYVE